MVTHVPLGHISKFVRGVTYKPADLIDNFSENSIVCMRTANIQEELDENDLKSIKSSVVKSNDKYLLEGDILVSTANSWNLVGKCCWVKKLNYPAVPGGFIAALRVDKSKADPRYVYHWFNSKKTQELARNCGRQTTNISNMDLNRCLSLELPLPSLAEQRRIAAILDKAEALRAKRREAIAKLDQLLQSVFLEMFGDPAINTRNWPVKKFTDIGSWKSGATPSKSNADYWIGSYPWVSPKDMKIDHIEDSQDHISDIVFKETNIKKILPNHILIVVRGMILAHSFPVAINTVPIAINQDMKAIELSEDINSRYLLSCLKALKPRILSVVSSAGHGTKRLDSRDAEAILIPVPEIELQEKFSAIYNHIYSQKMLFEKQYASLQKLNASLQAKFFQ